MWLFDSLKTKKRLNSDRNHSTVFHEYRMARAVAKSRAEKLNSLVDEILNKEAHGH